MAKLIAKTYGDALFELALEENKLDVIADEIMAILDSFNENPELSKLMNHPKIEKTEKCAVMENILKLTIGDRFGGSITADEVGLPVRGGEIVLPCGYSARWQR